MALDEGTRIWPFGDQWRVVMVQSQSEVRQLMVGAMTACQATYPQATFGINDNENVPPGTTGTVRSVNRFQAWVDWDNGVSLGLTPRDEVRIIG